jgi:chemotaxis protein MotA
MDLASFFGIISGIFLIIIAIIIEGDITLFWNIPGLMIVVGGTVSTTLLTFQFSDVMASFKAAYFVFTEGKQNPNRIINVKTSSRFLKKACGLIADSSEEDIIRSSLRTEIESLKMRHFVIQDVFRKMGMYSPAFGMLGTLIGLVQMLSNLQEPELIGPSMAIAILTTFYGSLLSTLIFLPIAGKLKARTILEVINLEIIFEGAICILENNNPIIVYERLSSYVPAKQRKPLASIRRS